MENKIYIEPCCAERQLPNVLRKAGADTSGRRAVKDAVAQFCTQGDVTVAVMMKSVSYLAGRTHTVTLVVNQVTPELLQTIAMYARRGWTKAVQLMTREDQSELVATVADDLKRAGSTMMYVCDKRTKSDMIAFEGEAGVVVIQGDMLPTIDPGLRAYSIAYGPTDSDQVKPALVAVQSRFRVTKKKGSRGTKNDNNNNNKDNDYDKSDQDVAPASTTEETGAKEQKTTDTDSTAAQDTDEVAASGNDQLERKDEPADNSGAAGTADDEGR